MVHTSREITLDTLKEVDEVQVTRIPNNSVVFQIGLCKLKAWRIIQILQVEKPRNKALRCCHSQALETIFSVFASNYKSLEMATPRCPASVMTKPLSQVKGYDAIEPILIWRTFLSIV